MTSEMSHIQEQMYGIQNSLPEKPTLEGLQEVNDIIIFKGLKELDKILEKASTTNDAKTKIFNALIGLGRYIEVRKENEYNQDKVEYIIEDKELLLNEEED